MLLENLLAVIDLKSHQKNSPRYYNVKVESRKRGSHTELVCFFFEDSKLFCLLEKNSWM